MLSIALTGGIGCGKSASTQLFYQLASKPTSLCKLEIIDADIIARHLLSGSLDENYSQSLSYSALKEVQQLFGSEIFDNKGYLQRDKLRSLIFSSKEKKDQLESLLHPLVYQAIFSQMSEIIARNNLPDNNKPCDIVIVAIPLLFETLDQAIIAKHFDRVLLIDVPTEIQVERSSQRDNNSAEQIRSIINNQIDRQTRLKQADDIIDNSGTHTDLYEKIDELWQAYCHLAKQ
ncbi:dephospho-CoA kinase [sulfur-oxidizing endosymbiont of Gigantopelta aegis]|uniref:dephospho-CoA kinase n=1 Tax=sulfur-oxidizing endosymbiont of Gigantopelta aegis TaxID=2794934 RepID=UPI0018DDC301|nr:dephospho-CoA kinase [sulfur-oxidizing endosymbiont of Gigantopelta aegis]